MKCLLLALLAAAGCGIALLATGCDALAVTDYGYVKGQTRAYSRLICEKKIGDAGEFQDSRMIWQQLSGAKLSGKPAADGFLASVSSIQGMDTFYIYVHSHEKLDDKRIIMDVTMQAHCVVNSMTMVYDNTVWRAKMLWVRTDRATWKIGAIAETSARVKTDPPKDVKPL